MTDARLANEFAGISDSAVSRPKLTKTGKIILGIAGASFVGMCAVTVPFILPAARRVCLPYVPATDTQVHNVMSLLTGCKPGRLVDLGSGDGCIVIEAAKRGFQATKQFCYNTHTHTYIGLMTILPGEPGLAGCSLDFLSTCSRPVHCASSWNRPIPHPS